VDTRGARARLCSDVDGGGSCVNITDSTRSLGTFNDQASYFQAY